MWGLSRWRRRRILARADLSGPAWEAAEAGLPLLAGRDPDARRRLRELATLFLHEKALEGAHGFAIDPLTARQIALQACLPVLNLGLDWLGGWVSVVVHPDEFVVDHEEVDEAGVVHRIREARSGESWERGPLVLSAAEVAAGGRCDGYNVILHEVAHKLDALNGPADGFPPLHRGMDPGAWTRAFTDAFDDLNRRLDAGETAPIDPYGAEAPEEFFAVATEAFFETPEALRTAYPAVYDQLTLFYRQTP